MRVSLEPVCIDLFRLNPVFTSLNLKTPVYVVPPVNLKVVSSIGETETRRANSIEEAQAFITVVSFGPTMEYLIHMNVSHTDERVQTDWRWPLSGIHSLMMVNSAQPGENKGCTLGCSEFVLFLTPKGTSILKLAQKFFQLHPWLANFFGKNRKICFFLYNFKV
jgi:hypothetical protein